MSSLGWRATSTQSRTRGQEGGEAGQLHGGGEGGAGKQNTQKLMNDKELTSFRKLTNWSTVK